MPQGAPSGVAFIWVNASDLAALRASKNLRVAMTCVIGRSLLRVGERIEMSSQRKLFASAVAALVVSFIAGWAVSETQGSHRVGSA
jgi:Co/Zn/Cd efflux system component